MATFKSVALINNCSVSSAAGKWLHFIIFICKLNCLDPHRQTKRFNEFNEKNKSFFLLRTAPSHFSCCVHVIHDPLLFEKVQIEMLYLRDLLVYIKLLCLKFILLYILR